MTEWICPKCDAHHADLSSRAADGLAHCDFCGWKEGDPLPLPDTSRRERIATAVLQGLCAGIGDYSPSQILNMNGMVDDALALADALIEGLDA